MPFVTTQMHLESIMLSKISQTQRERNTMISLTREIWKSWTQENREWNGGCQRLGADKWGNFVQRAQNSSYKICKLWGSNVQHDSCSQQYCIIHLKIVKRMYLKCIHYKNKVIISKMMELLTNLIVVIIL